MVMWFYQNYSYYEHHAHGHGDTRNMSPWVRPFVAIQDRFERGFTRFREGYSKLLETIFERRIGFAILFLVLCLGSWLLVPLLGQDFFPSVDLKPNRLPASTHRHAG